MPKEKNIEAVSKLTNMLSRCTIAVATNYQGLSVPEMSQLRRKLRDSGIEYRVVKNTLARLASERAEREGLKSILVGPTAIAFGYGDIAEPARILADYMSTSRTSLSITGALLGNRVLTREEVLSLSRLPSKEVLIAKLIGGMQTPIISLLNVLSANLRGLVGVLNARIKQLEGG